MQRPDRNRKKLFVKDKSDKGPLSKIGDSYAADETQFCISIFLNSLPLIQSLAKEK
jgi:hypothetical protein